MYSKDPCLRNRPIKSRAIFAPQFLNFTKCFREIHVIWLLMPKAQFLKRGSVLYSIKKCMGQVDRSSKLSRQVNRSGYRLLSMYHADCLGGEGKGGSGGGGRGGGAAGSGAAAGGAGGGQAARGPHHRPHARRRPARQGGGGAHGSGSGTEPAAAGARWRAGGRPRAATGTSGQAGGGGGATSEGERLDGCGERGIPRGQAWRCGGQRGHEARLLRVRGGVRGASRGFVAGSAVP